jgi:hypothetical protein
MHVSRRVEIFEVVSRSRRPRDPKRSARQVQMQDYKKADLPSTSDLSDGADASARKLVGFVVFPILLVATYFVSQIPYSVTAYRQFDNYANGKRVKFIGTYNGEEGQSTKVAFDGQTVFVVLDKRDMRARPRIGGKYWVTGGLQRSNHPTTRVTITNARLRPTTER